VHEYSLLKGIFHIIAHYNELRHWPQEITDKALNMLVHQQVSDKH